MVSYKVFMSSAILVSVSVAAPVEDAPVSNKAALTPSGTINAATAVPALAPLAQGNANAVPTGSIMMDGTEMTFDWDHDKWDKWDHHNNNGGVTVTAAAPMATVTVVVNKEGVPICNGGCNTCNTCTTCNTGCTTCNNKPSLLSKLKRAASVFYSFNNIETEAEKEVEN